VATKVTPSPRDDAEERLNDPALARKVETEVFRGDEFPKDKISVNAEYGVIYLRGEVPSQEVMEELTQRARGVDGVRAVENLTHLPGEPARTA
jgi:osmotically-inducible protein OsmY